MDYNKISLEYKEKEINKKIINEKLRDLAKEIIQKNPLENPFPIKYNINAKEANEEAILWIKKFKLIPDKGLDKFLNQEIIKLVSGAYPNCNLERLVIIHQWIIFLFLKDDDAEKRKTESVKALNERTMKVLQAKTFPTESDEPLTHAVYDLMGRIRKFVNETWINNILRKEEDYFKATVWEAQNREKNIRIPGYYIYLKMRLETGGAYAVFPLIEIAEKTSIPQRIFNEYLKDLNRMCNNIISWSNDVKSCPKEFDECFLNNLVFVTQRTFKCSLQEAIERCVNLHNKEVDDFEKAKNELYAKLNSETSDPELRQYAQDIRKYVEGLRYWMGSHYIFAKESPRYN